MCHLPPDAVPLATHSLPPDAAPLATHSLPPDAVALTTHSLPPDTVPLSTHSLPPDAVLLSLPLHEPRALKERSGVTIWSGGEGGGAKVGGDSSAALGTGLAPGLTV